VARSSFISFHYQRDYWRVQQILNIGALDQQTILPAQNWEEVKQKGDSAVEAWIDKEMGYKQAVIVLIGSQTASRRFVNYEIRRAWHIKKPLLGIRIHGLKDTARNTDTPGANPFASFGFSDSARTYSDFVPVFDPTQYTGKAAPTSNDIYAVIAANLATWASQGYRIP
jgi:hypothetical protein